MSADVLRRAAALMRERAEAARDVDECGTRWEAVPATDPDNNGWQVAYRPEIDGSDDLMAKTPYDYDGALARHLAGWHPAVALAVADSLDDAANVLDEAKGTPLEIAMTAISNAQVAVARAYLGEDA